MGSVRGCAFNRRRGERLSQSVHKRPYCTRWVDRVGIKFSQQVLPTEKGRTHTLTFAESALESADSSSASADFSADTPVGMEASVNSP